MSKPDNLVFVVADPLEVPAMMEVLGGAKPARVILCEYENFSELNLKDRTSHLLEVIGVKQTVPIKLHLTIGRLSLKKVLYYFRNLQKISGLNRTDFQGGLFDSSNIIVANKFSPIFHYAYYYGQCTLWRVSHSPGEDAQEFAKACSPKGTLYRLVLFIISLCKRKLTRYDPRRVKREYSWLPHLPHHRGLDFDRYISAMPDVIAERCDVIILFGAEDYSNEKEAIDRKIFRLHEVFIDAALNDCSQSDKIIFKFHPFVAGRMTVDEVSELSSAIVRRSKDRGFFNIQNISDIEAEIDCESYPAEILIKMLRPDTVIGPYNTSLLMPSERWGMRVIADSSLFPACAKREEAERLLARHIHIKTVS